MNPAWSVIFLTTLIGAAQGLFLALFGVEAAAKLGLIGAPSAALMVAGAVFALFLLVGGLAGSFFHLGHPERAWRAVAMWRTSWLSREVIVLPAFIAAVAAYAYAHAAGLSCTLWIGAGGVLLALALFVCTAMIYMCLKFLQEWHTPLTLANFLLLGAASGTLLAAALAQALTPPLAMFISAVFEAKHWSVYAYGGVGFVLAGQWLLLRSKKEHN
jgi:DMSO reductase anchor subunit